ncbi:MAG: replicative DNA helicase [Clostridia bacterium]|nr:replicative DNA helicase [Clostridia bacterium]
MALDIGTRKQPISLEAEQAVLGSILIKPESFEHIAGKLYADDFYIEEHRQIFTAMQTMFLQSRQIDTVTLLNTLVKGGSYDEQSGVTYLRNLADSVPAVSNIRDYAKIVSDKAILRRLITACEEISSTAYAEEGEIDAILDSSAQKIFDIAQKRDSRDFRHIRDVMQVVYKDLQYQAEHPNEVSGVKTGFSALDNTLVQLGKGDLVLIGARPGMGKTSFAMNIAVQVAKATGKAVACFSLEMPAEQLALRMLSGEALVDSRAMRSGQFNEDNGDWERIADATISLASCDILIDDTSDITPTDMKAKLRRVKNLGMVVIDYLQLMQSGKSIDNRVQEVGEISRNLKIMAKEFGVPILCCAQLSRGPEGRTVKKPMLSDLRDSGAIEQDADIVLFLYRDEYYKDVDPKAQAAAANTAEIIVAKNRHGAVGSVTMGWNAQFTKFRTLEENLPSEPPAPNGMT